MPYENEKANPLGYLNFMNSSFIKSTLHNYEFEPFLKKEELAAILKILPPEEINSDLDVEEFTPCRAVAIDGSLKDLELDNKEAEIGFIKIAVVQAFFEEMKKFDLSKPLDSVEYDSKCYENDVLVATLPGYGIRDSYDSKLYGIDKFRADFYAVMKELKLPGSSSKSLLEVFCDLVELEVGHAKLAIKCPDSNCRTSTLVGIEPRNCSSCGARLYITDELNVHGKFKQTENNSSVFSESMSSIERILMAGLILEDYSNNSYSDTVYITDGPLATFCSLALAKMLLFEFQDLSNVVLVGLEKSGRVYDFVQQLGVKDLIPSGGLMMVTDSLHRSISGKEAIVENIGNSSTVFYGRHFVYKTLDGSKVFVFTTPPIRGIPYGNSDNVASEWEDYPQLEKIIKTIEDSTIDLFGKNTAAISPIKRANEAASIPKNSDSILKSFVKEQRKKTIS